MRLVDVSNIHVNISVNNQKDLFEIVGGQLRDKGFTAADYVEALSAREMEFPTGLPVSGGVAIPHTDASHVVRDAIAIATLKNPVEFRQMGGDDDDTVDVRVVFMLALAKSGEHLTALKKVVKSIQSNGFISAIASAKTAEDIAAMVAPIFES
ncbi:PTS sugar transporter subunit IIA [Cutibacterium avidum]|uniref:PTS sugar transporter subunit IIA n=1 Tax=Cutibacterium avidum TaxID=33010 RepID=UPI00192AEB68|nr:PTS sugar transporter subunit IIA [Cutibacterium avidum]QQY15576.1 PTS sugar transporter subunit IIA [Cutibacterium avidum]